MKKLFFALFLLATAIQTPQAVANSCTNGAHIAESLSCDAGIYSFIFVKAMDDGKGIYYSPRSGNYYLVDKLYKIGINEGETVLVEIDSSCNWVSIKNPQNGSTSSVYSVQQIQY